MKRLLILLRDDAELVWLQLDGARIVARGDGPAPKDEAIGEIIAAVPGERVVVHWVELPDLAPAQAAAAARLLAADVTASPAAETHVAIGPRNADGECCLAVVDGAAMASWLARCRAAGIEPDHVVPAPILIPAPEEGLRVVELGDTVLVRGRRTAFAGEPSLAALLVGDGPVEHLDTMLLEDMFAAGLAERPIDLRQGTFARKQPWQINWRLVRRIAVVGGLSLLAMLATDLTLLLRHNLAADMTELRVAEEARRLLPRGAEVADPVTQAAARVAELRGPDFSPGAAMLLASLREVNGAELATLRYDGKGFTAGVSTARAGDLALVEQRIMAAGYRVEAGAGREEAGRMVVELTVTRQ